MWWAYASAIEFHTSQTLDPGSEVERFIHMNPDNVNAYRDVLADPHLRPRTIGGMWHPKLYSPVEDAGKLVILHFHGGAYVLGGCRPLEGGWGPNELAKCVSGFGLCPQYHLTLDDDGRFPAAIQDGVTAYRYLLAKGVSASNIVLSGDSAGGNLTITLLRYLVEHEGVMQLPRAVLLWSPWLDVGADWELVKKNSNFKTDYLPCSLAKWASNAYTRCVPANHRYISPLNNEFATKVPLFLYTGTAGVQYDDHMKFADAMNRIPCNRLEVYECVDAPHDIMAAGVILGWKEEAFAAMEAGSTFVRKEKERLN
ncbi:MAG: hypothetical protein MMC33_001100 [Icmadophila ericetorum]|nr:hypothetical protein [Icmadophila ericetorum]